MADIIFKNVSFSYDATRVLENVSFVVEAGEYIGIIGPNGGGKTTALKLMLGFLKPQSGSVHLLDQAPKKVRTKVGYVPQANSYDAQFPISVLEVVLTGSLSKVGFWGMIPSSVKRRARELLEEVGLKGLEERVFGSLSGGQAQKVLIARALMCDPQILLLDEPTANIDPQSEAAIFAYLKTFKGKKTILIVMHNFDAIVKNSERVLCFQHEVSSMKPSEVCDHFAIGIYHPIGGESHE
ncbi:MAG: High-affinity zinc uptake system ATP-binding protein ZnuC [Chlamydiae bacterium]|nr:High-affinity zinc uptake system ATP-binding protein ZnuC [Chlamydiota bacterium]